MTVLAVCNHKGGTGKTTSVIHIAAALGMSGYRTLVVDLDPQCFLTHMLGVDEPPDLCSSAMIFDGEVALRDVPVHSVHDFDLVPSSRALTRLMRRLNKPTDVYWARESLRAGMDYDYVIFDTAAAVTVYSLNALVASEFVLIPVTPEYQPVVGAEQTVRTAELVRQRLNPDLHDPMFLFTQVDFRKNSHTVYRKYLRGKYGDQIMRSIVRTSTALAETHSDGSTAFNNDPHSRGARDYANATDELLGLMHRNGRSAGSIEHPASDAEHFEARTENVHLEEDHAARHDGRSTRYEIDPPARSDAGGAPEHPYREEGRENGRSDPAPADPSGFARRRFRKMGS